MNLTNLQKTIKECRKMKTYIDYFKELCKIPHGSGNTKKISDYCENFAKEHSLRCIREDCGNIIIFKDGSKGFEKSEPVILQGHLDMVCVTDGKTEIDFENDGLTLGEDEDFIFAKGTTLGGDDGIAPAYAFEILSRNDLSHPPLEVVLTIDEETGMDGANALDVSVLKSKRLINIDSEDEGILLTSCAGGIRADVTFDVKNEKSENVISVKLTSLAGGHSGTEIDKGRQNAAVLLASLLKKAGVERIGKIKAGNADNAIPFFACALIEDTKGIKAKISSLFEESKRTFCEDDKNAELIFEPSAESRLFSKNDSAAVLSYITEVQNGIVSMSENVPGLVQTSLNLGVIETEENSVTLSHALRSSVNDERKELEKNLSSLAEKLGAKAAFHSGYPAWEFFENSILQKVFCEAFKKQYKKEMTVSAIHAGLECGILSGKIKGLDCVSFGPDIFGAHSADERLSKKSAERTFKLLLSVLEKLK